MVHWIDLRDHMRILGSDAVSGDCLEGLQYTEREYDSMFSHRPVYMNRLRSNQWKSLFEACGFEIVRWNPISIPLPEEFDRSQLQPPWCDDAEEELAVARSSTARCASR